MASSSSSSPEMSAAPSAAASSSQYTVQYSHFSREEVLEELSSRFILNLPDEELASLERVCFQVEQAHWYYEDFIREQNPSKFPSYTLKTFSEALFRACPPLHHWAHDHERTFATFMQYKTRVPVCGAIMLNDTWEKCVLVKGWKSSAGWGFPKGKINEQEPRPRCAAREVLEETGYDLEGQIVPEDVIELSIKEQSISLYIVPGVPEDFPFKTRTRKEISKIAWFKLSDLPTWKRSKTVPGKFYLISPFIGPLKAFIHNRKPRRLPRRVRKSQDIPHSQDAQISSEEEAGNPDISSTAGLDQSAQESSSQSSSADNGEPQTPSPLYSAPPLNYQPQESVLGADDAQAETLNLDGVDPHFARLLNSLSLSASASALNGDSKTVFAQPHASPNSSGTPDTPPNTKSQIDQTDWSMHVPGPNAVPLISASAPSGSISTHHPRLATTDRTAIPAQPSPSSSSIHLSASHNEHSPTSPSLSPSSSSPRPTASHGSFINKSPRLSRPRGSSKASADISPYLSRPHDIPKEMKYISMLENVAKESDRISSQLQHVSPLPRIPQVGSISRSTMAPGLSVSVPPASMFRRVDSPVIYSSAPAAALSSTVPSAPHQLPAIDPSSDDVFTVRPRTGAAFHPYPPPPRRSSVNDDNLRCMAPGMDPRRFLHPNGMSNPPSQMLLPSFVPPRVPSQCPPVMQGHANVSPLRVISQQQFPAPRLWDPTSLSAPPLPPSSAFAAANTPQPANNAHLLSILNTPIATPRTVPMHPGMNGAGPR